MSKITCSGPIDDGDVFINDCNKWRVVLVTTTINSIRSLSVCLVWSLFFERNTPAAFKRPIWAKAADWCMLFDIIRGKIKF